MGEGVRAAFGLAGGLALFLFGMENMRNSPNPFRIDWS